MKTILVISTTGDSKGGTHEYVLWELASSASRAASPETPGGEEFWAGWEADVIEARPSAMQVLRKVGDDGRQVVIAHKYHLFANEDDQFDSEYATSSAKSDWISLIQTVLKGHSTSEALVLEHGLRDESHAAPNWIGRTHELTHVRPSGGAPMSLYSHVKGLVVRNGDGDVGGPDWNARFDSLWDRLDRSKGHFAGM